MTDVFIPSLLAFTLTCIVIELTPGPNMGYLAALSVMNGWRAGLAAVAGVATGLSVFGIVAALGLATLIENSPLLYEILRWAGVGYLFWLAFDTWPRRAVVEEQAPDRDHIIKGFWRGFITNILNPKAGIFYVAVIPNFVAAGSQVLAQTLTLTAIFVAVATTIHAGIVLLAGRLHGMLSDPLRQRPVQRLFAVVMAMIAIWFAISTAR